LQVSCKSVASHTIETDFANRTKETAIVTVTTSKPISAIAGNSTEPIALLRDALHQEYKTLDACASCDRRKLLENGGARSHFRTGLRSRNSLLTGKTTGNFDVLADGIEIQQAT